MKTEYISPGKNDGYIFGMNKGRYSVTAIKCEGFGGYFVRFFDGKSSFTSYSDKWQKLPKYILSELDNFNSVVTRILEVNSMQTA